MSKSTPPTHQSDNEHTATTSYVVGFVLSLIFTYIPYQLVIKNSQTGNTLVATILGFALLQMMIQVFFFLHLGRGPKPFYNIVFFFATVGVIIMVATGSLVIMNNLYRNMSPEEITTKLSQDENISQVGGQVTGACQGTKASHIIYMNNDSVSPLHTDAKLCDSITFISQDDTLHIVGFGEHPEHTAYAGEDDLPIRKGRTALIVLSQSGTYNFHDHLNEILAGDFTVSP